jgi:hypothetical protein
MNRLVKLLVVASCFVLCGAATMLVPTGKATPARNKFNATPVKNHEPASRIWIEV